VKINFVEMPNVSFMEHMRQVNIGGSNSGGVIITETGVKKITADGFA